MSLGRRILNISQREAYLEIKETKRKLLRRILLVRNRFPLIIEKTKKANLTSLLKLKWMTCKTSHYFSNATGLDLDLLHKNVSLPSELYQSDDNMKIRNIKMIVGQKGKVSRKSERVLKKEKNNLFQFINCHQCKKIDNSVNMTTCSNDSCRESYCFNCLKKYFVIFF